MAQPPVGDMGAAADERRADGALRRRAPGPELHRARRAGAHLLARRRRRLRLHRHRTRRCPAISCSGATARSSASCPGPRGSIRPTRSRTALFFSDDGAGRRFYDRDADGRIVGHHTHDNVDVDLGIRPRLLGLGRLASASSPAATDGVRVVPVDGVTPETVLDNDICKPANFSASANGFVYYDVGDHACAR